MHSLDVMDVLATFLPDVGHVGWVGHRLAPEQCVLGRVERGAFGRDDDDRRTWWDTEHKKHHIQWAIFTTKRLQITITINIDFHPI